MISSMVCSHNIRINSISSNLSRCFWIIVKSYMFHLLLYSFHFVILLLWILFNYFIVHFIIIIVIKLFMTYYLNSILTTFSQRLLQTSNLYMSIWLYSNWSRNWRKLQSPLITRYIIISYSLVFMFI